MAILLLHTLPCLYELGQLPGALLPMHAGRAWPRFALLPRDRPGPLRPAGPGSRARRRRSMRASWKPAVRAAASTVAPWPVRCPARSGR